YAKNMVRRQRIRVVFLHQRVGMAWDKVHEEAHNFEHRSSDELINRMEEMQDLPSFDQLGDPIQSKEGILPEQKKSLPLSLLKGDVKAKVVRVNDFDDGFLNYLSRIGIELGKEIYIKEVFEFDHSLLVKVDNMETNISSKLAANIFVEEGLK